MQIVIDDYFRACDLGEDVTRPNKRGDLVTWHRKIPYTVPGLVLHLGFSSRSSLFDYCRENQAFSSIIHRARTRIEQQRITAALCGDVDARIASLDLAANFGYNPEKRIEINQVQQLSERELDAEIERLARALRDLRGLAGGDGQQQLVETTVCSMDLLST